MMFFLFAVVVAAASVPASPVTPSKSIDTAQRPGDVPRTAGQVAEVRARVAACNANMLVDTVASITVKGQLRKSRVLLCSTPGQSTPQKTATLQKAIISVKAHPQLSTQEKTRIVGLMQAKISELAKRQ